MLAEVVVVSVVVASVLVTMYVSLNRISSAYETRNRYYDIDAEYYAMEVNDYLNRTSKPTSGEIINNELDDNIYINKFKYISAQSFYVEYDKFNSFSLKITNGIYNQTLKDYIGYLNDNIDLDADYKYMIVAELCKTQDDCYYYTLKVGDNNA